MLHQLFQIFWDFTVWLDRLNYPGTRRGMSGVAYDPSEAWSIWVAIAGAAGFAYYRRWRKNSDTKGRHPDMRGSSAPSQDVSECTHGSDQNVTPG